MFDLARKPGKFLNLHYNTGQQKSKGFRGINAGEMGSLD